MKKTTTRWFFLLGGVLLVVVGGFVLLTWAASAVLRAEIETVGSQAADTPVRVRAASVSLLSGHGEIRGLTIDNPPGFDSEHVLTLDRIALRLDVGSLGSEVLVIKDLTIEGVRLMAEQKLLKKGNLLLLRDNLRAYAETAADTSAWTTLLVIEQFTVTNLEAALRLPLVTDKRVAIPDVYARDIGRASVGVSIPEVPYRMLEPILSAALKVVQQRMLGV